MLNIILFAFSSFLPPDSIRMETINGKQFVVHQVGEKETLYSIARRYGSTILAVLEQNPTADAGLEVGQILKVPYIAKAKTQSATKTADGLIHTVAPQETLFSIARLYNVSVDDIKTWNNLKENSLSVGQAIVIKRKSALTEPPPAVDIKPAEAKGAKTHTVAAKETLYSISRQYGMSVQQLKDWNGIQGNELSVGQVLSVVAPASLSTTTTVTKTTPVVTTNTTTTSTTTTPTYTTPKTTMPITISENVAGTDEIKEVGTADLIEGTDGNRKYLAQHRTVKPGTILKIRNLATNQEVFVRVTGPIVNGDDATIIRVSKSAHDRLGATDPKFRAEITYYK